MNNVHNPNCDGDRCTHEKGEVRVHPTGGDSNAILCRECFQYEMAYRRIRNRDLGNAFQFKLCKWEDLRVYEVS